jgi:hypothetical protein
MAVSGRYAILAVQALDSQDDALMTSKPVSG